MPTCVLHKYVVFIYCYYLWCSTQCRTSSSPLGSNPVQNQLLAIGQQSSAEPAARHWAAPVIPFGPQGIRLEPGGAPTYSDGKRSAAALLCIAQDGF